MKLRASSKVTGLAVIVLAMSAGAGVGSASAVSPPTPRAMPAGVWHAAAALPGIVALNKGGYTELDAESCPSQGNCSAGGEYRPVARSTRMTAFVANEVAGTWRTAIEAPGIATLNTGGFAQLHTLTCASVGNCAAGGGFREASGAFEAYLIDEVAGTWRKAFEVAGIAPLNAGGTASIDTISCPTAGNCSAGGDYTDNVGHVQAFVVDEVRGTWGHALEVPGTAALNVDGNALVDSISCPSAGNCLAGGGYKDGSAAFQAFVDSEVNGTWGTAIEVPGSAALNAGSLAAVSEVTCASPGNCSIGGDYRDSSFHRQVFLANEVGGTWHSAFEPLGTGVLNAGGAAYLYAISCATANYCTAGGSYLDQHKGIQSFLVDDVAGKWGRAFEVSGTGALNVQGGGEGISVISCFAPGTCAASGDYQDQRGGSSIYDVSEVDGVWGTAIQVPGSAALNADDSATTFALSCTASGWCGAGGNYLDHSGNFEDFVNDFYSAPVVTTVSPHAGPMRGGVAVVIRGSHLSGASVVSFGRTNARGLRVLSSDAIRVVVPAGAGTVNVRVTTPGGTSAVTLHDRFAYAGVPSLSSVSPGQGSAKGGTTVVLRGTNLLGTTEVLFGARRATKVVVLSAHAIRATTPAGGGSVDVRVHAPGGVSAITTGARFTYHP
jgi:hypothetical protein